MADEIFSWVIIIEHGTVLESCAIDALMIVIHKDRDMWTYSTHDKMAWVDFKNHESARKKAIQREFMQRYA